MKKWKNMRGLRPESNLAPKGELVHQGIDVILDEGAFGWEPALYVLAHNPLELVDRMHRIVSML